MSRTAAATTPSDDLTLVCDTAKDNISHIFDCVLHVGLHEWVTAVMSAMQMQSMSTAELVLRGVGDGLVNQQQVDALRSAVAMAIRRSRMYVVMNHAPMRGHSEEVVNEAKRQMRQSISIDWVCATTWLAERPYEMGHRSTRPGTVGEFRHRWEMLCTVHNNSSGEVRYKRILMPVAMATESDDDTDEDGW